LNILNENHKTSISVQALVDGLKGLAEGSSINDKGKQLARILIRRVNHEEMTFK